MAALELVEGSEKVSEDETNGTIDETKRVLGRVVSFFNRKGFGFVNVINSESNVAPGGNEEEQPEKVFVHWKQIQTSDRWPQLVPETEVEFFVGTQKDGRKFAQKVTAPGGGDITNEQSSGERVVKDAQMGTVKFYDARKGFGFIELAADCEMSDGETLSKGADIHVGRESILSKDDCPNLRQGMEVKFVISRGSKGLTCMEVTDKEGEKISVPQRVRNRRSGNGRGGRFNNGRGGNGGRGNNGRGRGRKNFFGSQAPMPQLGTFVEWEDSEKLVGWIEPRDDLSVHNIDLSQSGGRVCVNANDINGDIEEGDSVCFSVLFNKNNKQINATQVSQVDPEQFKNMTPMYGNYIPSVLSLLVEESCVSKILGSKGALLREINQSSGAMVQIVELEKHFGNKRSVNCTGYAAGLKNAALMIFDKLYSENQEESEITFLFHDIQGMMGRIIGRNGRNVKLLREIEALEVTVEKTHSLQGQPMSSLKLEGPCGSVKQGVEKSVEMLTKLYHDTVAEYFNGYQQYYFNNNQPQPYN